MPLHLKQVAMSLIVLPLIFGLLCWVWMDHQLNSPIRSSPFNQPMLFVVHPGESFQQLAFRLNYQCLWRYPTLLKIWARWHRIDQHIQAGSYAITATTTMKSLLHAWVWGDVATCRLTIVEGWRFSQLRHALKMNPCIHSTIDHLSDQQVMKGLGHPHHVAEGHFFPSTYEIEWGETDQHVLKRAYTIWQIKGIQAWQHRAQHLPYHSLEQALVVASLIEKETCQNEEKPLIAGVILKRWSLHRPLQIDSSVVYALGRRFSGHLKHHDLSIQSPYNTYTHCGLPPTSIAFPSQSSLLAALHPIMNHNLYFLAQPGRSRHQFFVSYKMHRRAIMFQRYKYHYDNNPRIVTVKKGSNL